MTLQKAIEVFINLGYWEDENGIQFYSQYDYDVAEKIIRDALKQGDLVVKKAHQT